MLGPSAAGDTAVVVVVVLAPILAACGLPPRTDDHEPSDVYDTTPRAVANDNRTMAGTLHRGVLDVALDVVAARSWSTGFIPDPAGLPTPCTCYPAVAGAWSSTQENRAPTSTGAERQRET